MFQSLAITPAGCRRSFPRHLLRRITTLAISAIAALVTQVVDTQTVNAEPGERPNIVLIMADDLGFSDLGCYGGEIETPHLDQLAAEGLRFTQFYNTARCWPTRAALLTGYYAQHVRRDRLPGLPSGGRGKRPAWAPLLPQLLAPQGYRSYHSGKWHLDGMPLENGFDRSYYLRDQGRFFNPKIHYKDDQKLPPVEPGSDYYGTIAIADHAIECLEQHAADDADRPFFHYVAFTAPHFPLHALPEDIAKYQQRYQAGWDEIRQRRWQRISQEGLVGETAELSDVERDIGPPYHFPEALKTLGSGEVNRPLPWNELTEQQQEFQAAKMAIHAAMIDRMDREVGRILEQLRRMQAWDNTLIFFLSDNGASAEIMVRDDGHDPRAAPGSAATYLCLGPGWSTSSNTPFRRHKTWVHQGGIATPLIVHWPKHIRAQEAGTEEAGAKGELRRQPGHVIDLVPTILEVAGAERPRTINGTEVPEPPGVGLRDQFNRTNGPDAKNSQATPRTLWWSHEGHRAIRRGDWKLVAAKGEPWELYNLAQDATETNNVAEQHPQLVDELAALWQSMQGEFVRDAKADLPQR